MGIDEMSKWIKTISESEFDEPVKKVNYEGIQIALFRLEDGIYAINDVCSHERASLAEGVVEGGQVECPQHGARFDIKTGKNLSFPAVTPVDSYPVKIEDGYVFVQVD